MANIDRVCLYQKMAISSVPAVPSGVAWPSGKLVVPPGDYGYDYGQYFDCTKEGFYSFWSTNGASFDGGALIVYQSDVMTLMASLARACGYGVSDEGSSIAAQIATARQRALWLRCGPTISFVEYWCQQLGIPYREVHFLTGNTLATPGLDPTLDPYDDNIDVGHELIEVKVNGNWVLVDVATNAAYQDSSGNWLSVSQVIASGVANCMTVALADPDYEQANWSPTYDPTTFANIRLRPQNIARWRQGIYQIPGFLDSDGNIYYYVPPGVTNNAAWISSLASNYRVLSQTAWLAKYYS